MKVNGMPMRGLDENIIDFINSSDEAKGLREIFESIKNGNKEELFVGIRNNYISIYFKCMGVFKEISFVVNNGKVNFDKVKTDKKYLKPIGKEKADKTLLDIKGITEIKKGIKEHYKGEYKKEKDYQQKTVLSNNKDVDSKWFCVDLEYQTSLYGRFDIIAISKKENCNGKHELAVIELKVGNGAMGTNKEDLPEGFKDKSKLLENESEWNKVKGSGITGHFSKFIGFLNDEQQIEELKDNVLKIIETYYKTSLCDVNVKKLYEAGKEKAIIFDEPKIIFLNYTDAKSKLASLKKGFINNVTENDYSIKKVWDGDILKKYNDRFLCVFRDEEYGSIFSDIEISEAKNLFDVEAYR